MQRRCQSTKYPSRLSMLTALTACLFMTACESSNAVEKGTSGERKFVTIGTAPGGGAFSAVGNAIANVVDASKGDSKMKAVSYTHLTLPTICSV